MAKTPKAPCEWCDDSHGRGACPWPYRTRAEMMAARTLDYSDRPTGAARIAALARREKIDRYLASRARRIARQPDPIPAEQLAAQAAARSAEHMIDAYA